MSKLFIEYNPYLIETKIMLDDRKLESELFNNKKFVEYIELLPQFLESHITDEFLEITFFGTQIDFNDLKNVLSNTRFKEAKMLFQCCEDFEIKCEKITAIKDMLENGKYEEIYTSDLKASIEEALNDDFKTNIISTMSAGKSTLINALLRKKIIPSKNEACTTVVTEIKDVDKDVSTARVYNNDDQEIDFFVDLSLKELEILNDSPEATKISIKTKIPFLKKESELSLVLVDTPGPNNTNNIKHKETTLDLIKKSSKSLIIYLLNATQLGVNDDNELLSYIASTISASKNKENRFFFILNKLDSFNKSEDDIKEAIENTRKYLANKGINNATIFPISALNALEVREFNDAVKLTGYSSDEFENLEPQLLTTIAKINRIIQTPEYHLDRYVELPAFIQKKIDEKKSLALENFKSTDQFIKSNAMKELALIHSGILGLEESINLYLNRYATASKIRNVVETFDQRLQDLGIVEELTTNYNALVTKGNELDKSTKEEYQIVEQLNSALKHKDQLGTGSFKDEFINVFNSMVTQFRGRIDEFINNAKRKLEDFEVQGIVELYDVNIDLLLKEFNNELNLKLDELMFAKFNQFIQEFMNLVGTSSTELKYDYINLIKLKNNQSRFELTSLKELVRASTREEQVKVGEREVENLDKKWFKPWTWAQPKIRIEPIMENQPYINGNELAKNYYEPIKEILAEDEVVEKFIVDNLEVIKDYLATLVEQIDGILLTHVERINKNKIEFENTLQQSNIVNDKLMWIKQLISKFESLLNL